MDSLDISSINKCFVSLGLEAVDEPGDLTTRLNDLTLYHMNWLQEKGILEERCAKLAADGTNYLNMVDRLKGELEGAKRELTSIGEKERQLRVKNKNLASRLKSEEEEVKKLHLVMEHKQDHFNHEMRKKERESAALKDKLNKKIMEKKTEKRNSQQVINTMPRSGVNRGKWAGNDEREELYKQFVGGQEEKNKELLNENDHLRHCLSELEAELINFLNDNTDKDESFMEGADLTNKIQAQINMPYTVVKDTFKDSIDDKIQLIREKHKRILNNKDLEDELTGLRKTIELQQLTITEQGAAIEDCSCKEGRQNYSDLHDAELDLRFQSLLTQQQDLDKAKASLAQEKKELDVLANKIKDDHKRFRAERTLMMESDMLKTPSINSIKRENNTITVTDKMKIKPSLREGHLFFSPAPAPDPGTPVMNTDEFKRELARTSNIQGLHGRILNENTQTTPVSKKILNTDTPNEELDKSDALEDSMLKIKTQLFNQYMNTPV